MNAQAALPAGKAPVWRELVGKGSAGLILGFALAIGLSGLLVWFTPGEATRFNGKHQLAMWSVAMFWNLIFAASFAFRNAKRAWLWLGVATVVSHGIVQVCRHLMH